MPTLQNLVFLLGQTRKSIFGHIPSASNFHRTIESVLEGLWKCLYPHFIRLGPLNTFLERMRTEKYLGPSGGVIPYLPKCWFFAIFGTTNLRGCAWWVQILFGKGRTPSWSQWVQSSQQKKFDLLGHPKPKIQPFESTPKCTLLPPWGKGVHPLNDPKTAKMLALALCRHSLSWILRASVTLNHKFRHKFARRTFPDGR